MKYLGTRYLKNWIKERFTVKDRFEYGKIRGDEWLKGEYLDIFCIQGKIIHVSIYQYSENGEIRKESERKSYYLENGEWILRYNRIGKDIKIYK